MPYSPMRAPVAPAELSWSGRIEWVTGRSALGDQIDLRRFVCRRMKGESLWANIREGSTIIFGFCNSQRVPSLDLPCALTGPFGLPTAAASRLPRAVEGDLVFFRRKSEAARNRRYSNPRIARFLRIGRKMERPSSLRVVCQK